MPMRSGRPRMASRELLQEAAFELFQLRGYSATSVEQIAKTAGFSRATFFNLFTSKAELFWVETDDLIDALSTRLEQLLDHERPPSAEEALLEYAAGLESASIPWALQNFHLIDGTDDLIASGSVRVLKVNTLLQQYMSTREQRLGGRQQGVLSRGVLSQGMAPQSASPQGTPEPSEPPQTEIAQDPLALRARAAALSALLLTALLDWINAGVHRGSLKEHLKQVVARGS